MKAIRLFAFDVDGVLTDGSLIYSRSGASQTFSARDGAGIVSLVRSGLTTALISFRDLESTRRRARDLGIPYLILGCHDKRAALEGLCSHLGIDTSEALFMGDDEMDVPALEIAGLPACPSDAHYLAKAACQVVTTVGGGHGAVREIIDMFHEGRLE
jgi:3-deoxy-D-manno-octulosonate 8-phosphate phosphatase (KDO 8-P phosphatase)